MVWLIVPAAAAIIFHFIYYRRKLPHGELFWPMLAVSVAVTLGGLGAGASAFLNAELRSGIDIVLDESGFDKLAANADIVITGEGRFDSQSVNGKVMSGVCRRAAKEGAKVYAVCGCASNDADPASLGIEKLFVSSDGTHSMGELQLSCRQELFDAASALAEEIMQLD